MRTLTSDPFCGDAAFILSGILTGPVVCRGMQVLLGKSISC